MATNRVTGLDEAELPLTGDEWTAVVQLSATVTISGVTISAAAADNSFNDSANGFVTAGFAIGDRVNVDGFTGNVANNLFVGTVTALTAGKMTIGGTDGDVIVDDAAGETVTITKWTSKRASTQSVGGVGGAGGGGSGNAWRLAFGPMDNEAPSASFAILDTRNGHPVLDFDAAADKSAIFTDVLPTDYDSGLGGVRLFLYWSATSATSGDVVWNAAIERINLSGLDIDADSFATAVAATTTAPGTSGMVVRTTIDLDDGAEMDSLAAGELFRLKITRDADNVADTMTGDAELLFAVLVSQ